ncbi:PACE efflux transporter [Dongshaea marina]|uniref:PACE efflux transporter n=1 Tax=Dongshaea marina TaxID=2047966 RepID=UPI000D3E965C|nr:PACE efflux transporter [Dongshaea marina]
MRTTWDRIRHTLLFEICGILAIVPLSSTLFHVSGSKMGALALACMLVVPLWNFFYNLRFDKLMLKTRGTVEKTLGLRVLHAIGFEGVMLVVAVPLTAWWFSIGLWQALTMDLAMALFYLVYAYLFNWAYDWGFPLPAQKQPLASK